MKRSGKKTFDKSIRATNPLGVVAILCIALSNGLGLFTVKTKSNPAILFGINSDVHKGQAGALKSLLTGSEFAADRHRRSKSLDAPPDFFAPISTSRFSVDPNPLPSEHDAVPDSETPTRLLTSNRSPPSRFRC